MDEQLLGWILTFFFIECAVILLFIMSCYGFKLYFMIKNRTIQKDYKQVLSLVENNQAIPQDLAKKIPIVLSVIQKLDAKNPTGWAEQRTLLVKEQLLPRVRPYINSRSWEKRYWLILCFEYYIAPEDSESLIKLIHDRSTIVSLNAIRLASSLGQKVFLKEILARLAVEPHSFHTMAIHTLTPLPHWIEVIQESFVTSTDPWVKKIGYELLRQIGSGSECFEMAKQDCFHKNINVRLAAIRVLPYLDKSRYLETYKQLMLDEQWLVRNAIVKTLREVQDQHALDLLEHALSDPHWRVRANTAKTLAYYGEKGAQLLAQNKTVSPGADEAEYFLQIQHIRKNKAHD